MSSWERSRYIPWDRIPLPDTRVRQPGEAPPLPLEDERERIIRKLQRESMDRTTVTSTEPSSFSSADTDSNMNGTDALTSASAITVTPSMKVDENKVIYTHMDLLRQAAFGGCIGTITGSVFGFMDGMRNAGELPILQKASNMAKGRYILQGTTRSATLFGTFFGAYHIVRYGVRVAFNPGEYGEIGLASPIALGALWAYPPTRHALPYGAMLIVMDSVNLYMRKPGM
jgi:hypothetical protein